MDLLSIVCATFAKEIDDTTLRHNYYYETSTDFHDNSYRGITKEEENLIKEVLARRKVLDALREAIAEEEKAITAMISERHGQNLFYDEDGFPYDLRHYLIGLTAKL